MIENVLMSLFIFGGGILYLVDVLMLFFYGVNLFFLVFMCAKHYHKSKHHHQEKRIDYPLVTVQIPIFNEKYVAERVIRAAAAIDYPREKLEIQVLDDSTDETLLISRKTVDDLKKQGLKISLHHRKKRTGQKGGALREALNIVHGDFIAIFDADFIPAEDILKKGIPYFLEDEKLGMLQTRWDHVNADFSLLTRAQAMAIDAHFIVEQSARHGAGYFFNFNGTAGIWRKQCIEDSGNWQDDTLTEDLDLSYRSQMRGWTLRYVRDIANPSELPVMINAYKSQQFRWAKGSLQTLFKLLKTVLKQESRVMLKIQAFLHLSYYMVHPLLIANILLTIPALIISSEIGFSSFPPLIKVIIGFFSIAALGPPVLMTYGQFKLHPKNWTRKLRYIPVMMLLGTGVAVNNSKAFLEALFGKKSDFIRTPKHGIEAAKKDTRDLAYHIPFSAVSFFELFFFFYSIAGILTAILTANYPAIPFLLIHSLSFLYVFSLGLIQSRPKKIKTETSKPKRSRYAA